MKFEFCRRVDMTTNELVIVVSIGDEKYYLTNEAYSDTGFMPLNVFLFFLFF